MAVELAPELLEILACPNCHGAIAVDHEADELVCLAADCGLAYPVRQGIPVLLIDEARRPEPMPRSESSGADGLAAGDGTPSSGETGPSSH
jgi:uncharacterized protein YbaR (Trm112 family)